jgi:hypothetical protein
MPVLEGLFGDWGTVVLLGGVLAVLLAAFAWLETHRVARRG